MERRDKINYYLDLAEVVAQRCTCLRRHYGAVIVKNDEVISTGYVGAPRGRKTAPIWAIVSGRSSRFPGESGMSSAAASMPKPTQLSVPPGRRCWAVRSFWWG